MEQSNFIIKVENREVSYFNQVRPYKLSILIGSFEVFDSLDDAIAVAIGFVKEDSYEETYSKVHYFAHILDLAPGSLGEFATITHFYGGC